MSDRLELIRQRREARKRLIAERRAAVEQKQVRDGAGLGDKLLDVPRQFIRGAGEGALGTRIAWNKLTGDDAEAFELEADRDALREHLGPSLSAAGTVAGGVGRLGYEVGEFVVPGKALTLASKLMQLAPKTVKGIQAARAARAGDVAGTVEHLAAQSANAGAVARAGRALGKGLQASEKTAGRRMARDVALAAPLNVTKAADRSNSVAGALADVTDSERLDQVADSQLGRTAVELATDVVGNAAGEALVAGGKAASRAVKARLRANRINLIRERRQLLGDPAGEALAGGTPSSAPGGSSPIQPGATSTSRIESPAALDQAPPSNTSVNASGPDRTTLAGSPRSVRTPDISSRSSVTFTPKFEVGGKDPLTNRNITQPTDDVNTILQLADEALPELKGALERTAFEIPGLTVFGARVKHRKLSGAISESGLHRIQEKINNPRQPRPAHTLSDYLGGRLWLDDGVKPEEVIARLEAKGWRVIEDDGDFLRRGDPKRPDAPAYRGRHLQMVGPNGLSAEVQLVPRKVGELQEVAHLPYNILRTDHAPAELVQQLTDMSDAVWRLADEAPPHAPIPVQRILDDLGPMPGHSDVPTAEEAQAAIAYAERFIPWYRQVTGAERRLEGLTGADDRVLFSDRRQMPVRYRVVEAGTLQPSNDAGTFEPNPRYPAGVQGRQYHGEAGRAAREHTILETQRLDPLGLLDRTVKVSGTPLVTADGTVVAGNQRTMMLQRAGTHAPERAAAYRQQLAERAQLFGIDPAQLEGMKEPVLVRELLPGNDYDLSDPAFLGELNRLSDTRGTKAKDAASEGATRAAQLSGSRSMEHLTTTLEPEESLAEYLETSRGRAFVAQLTSDGVIAQQEIGRYLAPTGQLTSQGKLLIRDTLLAAAVGNPQVVTTAPARALQQLEAAVPAIVRANQVPGYGVEAELQGALEILAARAAASEQLPRAMKLEDFLGQGDLMGERWDEAAVAIARALDGQPRAKVREAFEQYARLVDEAAAQSQADDMFGAAPMAKDEALARSLGTPEPAGSGNRPGFIGQAPNLATGTVKVDLQGDVVVASIRGAPSRQELEKLFQVMREAPSRKFLYRVVNDGGQTIGTGRSLVDMMADLRNAGGLGVRPEDPAVAASRETIQGKPPRPGVLGPAELGVRMMSSMAGGGIGGAGGYAAGMQTEGTEEERRRKALLLAVFGAAVGAGAPWIGFRNSEILKTGTPHPRAGAIGDLDLFGNPVASGDDAIGAQADLFGGAQPARDLSGHERAARSELEKIRQQLTLKPPADVRARLSRRAAELERLVNRGQKIGAEELQHRAAGEGDLFGNRTGAIGEQPRKLQVERRPGGIVADLELNGRPVMLNAEADGDVVRVLYFGPEDAPLGGYDRGFLRPQDFRQARELLAAEFPGKRIEWTRAEGLRAGRSNRIGAIGVQPPVTAAGRRTHQGRPDVTPPEKIDPSEYVNLGKFTLDPDGEKRLAAEVQRVVSEQQLDPKRKITWDETRALARELGVDAEALSGIAGRMNGAELLAVRNIINTNVARLVEIERQLLQPAIPDEELAQLREFRDLLEGQNDRMLSRLVKERSRAGRDLNNLKILSAATDDPVFWLQRAKKMLGDQPLTDQVRTELLALLNAGDKAGLAKKVAELKRVTVGDRLLTLWKAGLLTNPTTHAANLLGNSAMAGLETVKEVPAAIADALIGTVTGRRTKAGLALGTFEASASGARRGIQEAKRVLKNGASADVLGKFDVQGEVQYNNVILDTYTRSIFRGLAASDRVFRGLALQRSLENQARVIARREGLKGSARRARIKQLAANPTDEMALTATTDAELATFQDNSLLAQAASGVRRPFGVVGNVLLPFVRTPANVASRAAEYSPVGAAAAAAELLIAATRGAADAKLQRKVADRLGRSATGTAIIAVGYTLASQGLLSAGRPTPGSAKADQFDLEGKQANAVLVNGQWHQVQRISPLGNLLVLGGHLWEAAQDPELSAGGMAVRSVTALGQTVYEQSFLRGVDDLTAAIRDERGGAQRFFERTAASVVPSLAGRVAGAVDPTVRQADGAREAIQARIPGATTGLEPKIDQFGRDVVREDGLLSAMLNPFNSRTDQRQADPLVAELARVGVNLTRLKKKAGESRERYVERQRVDGQELEALLAEAIESDDYLDLPEEAAALIELEPRYAGRDARELAKELQRGMLEDVVRRARAGFTRDRREEE